MSLFVLFFPVCISHSIDKDIDWNVNFIYISLILGNPVNKKTKLFVSIIKFRLLIMIL